MPEKVSIFVEAAPPPFGHFAQVIKFGNSVHVSGQLPLSPETRKLVSDRIDDQSRAVLKSLTAVMQACTGQMSNILSMRVYLTDLADHSEFDKISKEFFFFTPPARSVLAVSALPFGARIMIDAIAELNPVDMQGGKFI